MAARKSATASTRPRRTTPLQPSSPVPLYHQLAITLREELLHGHQEVGSRYHSDRELIARYGLSLLTVRQAVKQLVEEGLLERRHGSGTFVGARLTRLRAAAPAAGILFTGWSLSALSGWEAMFFRDIYAGIHAEAAARDLRLMIDDPDHESANQVLAAAAPRHLRGVIALLGSSAAERATAFSAGGMPVVTINFQCAGLPAVLADDRAAGRLATEHLLELGHRRLAHLNSGEQDRHWLEVKASFIAAVRAAGLDPSANPVYDSVLGRGGTIDAGYECARRAWAHAPHPTGLVAGNDFMAIGALRFLRDHGVDVPAMVSVVGIDDLEAAEIVEPPLTSVAVDRHELGRAAVRTLVALLDGAGASPPPISARLVKRRSSANPPE